MLYDIEGAIGSGGGHHEGFMGELGEVIVLAMKGHDPAANASCIVDALEQSFAGVIRRDHHDCVAASHCQQSVQGHRQMGRCRGGCCPSHPGGH